MRGVRIPQNWFGLRFGVRFGFRFILGFLVRIQVHIRILVQIQIQIEVCRPSRPRCKCHHGRYVQAIMALGPMGPADLATSFGTPK